MSLVAFIIGARANGISASIAATLKANGYLVAFGSRAPDVDAVVAQGFFPVAVDASEETSIRAAFERVAEELGPPNVVVYNAASLNPPTDPTDPLTIPPSSFTSAASIGTNIFHAAHCALPHFHSAPHLTHPKAFIVTGTILPFLPYPKPYFISLRTQKAIAACLVDCFARAYGDDGVGFYFASMVSSEGEIPPVEEFEQSGEVHARVYWELINRRRQGDWDYRFTFDGKKYEEDE